MSEDNVLHLHDLSSDAAHVLLNDIAFNHSERVIILRHAQQRMDERNISIKQVLNCLKNGIFKDEPVWNNGKNNWQMTLETITAGDCIGLGVAIGNDKKGNKIIIITAYKQG